MKLGISGLFVQPTRVGGAEQMLQNMLTGFAAIRKPDDEITLFRNPVWCSEVPNGIHTHELSVPSFFNRFMQETLLLPSYTRGLDSVLFPNYFLPPYCSAATTCVTMLDVQYRTFPQHFSRKKRMWLDLSIEHALRRADRVISISDFTRNELIKHFGDWAGDKIRAIRIPISWDRFTALPTEQELAAIPTGTLVLAVAAHYPHKNLATLIRAFKEVHKVRDDLKLVLVGQLAERLIITVRGAESLPSLVRELGLEDSVVITGHISDAHMGQLLRTADLFVFPSLYEGFGMPVVEALGMGLPVLTTRCTSIPEVSCGLAHFVDNPLDKHEWADRIITMLEQPASYAPDRLQVDRLRSLYAPETVAAEYYSQLS